MKKKIKAIEQAVVGSSSKGTSNTYSPYPQMPDGRVVESIVAAAHISNEKRPVGNHNWDYEQIQNDIHEIRVQRGLMQKMLRKKFGVF